MWTETPGYRRVLAALLGVLAAGLLFEVALRPFVAAWDDPPGAIRTVRNYTEGFSAAHFEADGLGQFGNRLTGNPPVPGAPEGMIVGDSHVVALAVRDSGTMGAVVERLARAAGRPVNVRQYGWAGANAPTYLANAESLQRARNPAWIAVVVNEFNIGVNALTTTSHWRMEVAPDYTFRLIDLESRSRTGVTATLREWVRRSTLTLALWNRLGQIRGQATARNAPSLAGDAAARVPRATLRGLKRVFGSRLLVVYTPSIGGLDYDAVEPAESELQRVCAEEDVACISVRDALVRDRYQHSRLSRGFHNTAPGLGHFNAIGHQIIGQEIWRYLSSH